MHFVEAKSHPSHPLQKVAKTRTFCKDREHNVQKPTGFSILRFIGVQKPMSVSIVFIIVWYTSLIKCLLFLFALHVR